MLSLKKNSMPILPLLMVEHPIGLALNLHELQSSIALRVWAGIVLLSSYILNFNRVPGERFFFSFFFFFWGSTPSY